VLIDALRTVHDVEDYDAMDDGVQKQYLGSYYRTVEDDESKTPYSSQAVAFWRSVCGSRITLILLDPHDHRTTPHLYSGKCK
jgi:hypothetical protein